jgi:uncharacterized protein (TIGR00255 family)
MIRSMTGFGRAEGPAGSDAVVEVSARSVNHRSLDVTVKLRDSDAALEPVLRKAFVSRLGRGKVEVSVRLRRDGEAGTSKADAVSVDTGLLASAVAAIREAAESLGVPGKLEARDLLGIPGAFTFDSASPALEADEVAAVEAVAAKAADALNSMREAEGREIAADLSARLDFLEARRETLASRREEIVSRLLANLRERLRALAAEVPFDSGRLEQEAAIAADKADVAEELQRLAGHLSQFRRLIDPAETDEPVGKKLEFLTQEILRELNTLGAKAKDLQLVRDVLDMKSETEKIREQVANVE